MKNLRTVLKITLILTINLFYFNFAHAAPSIQSLHGYISNGSTVSFSGENFGNKPIAAPILWDDFDSGATGDSIESEGVWTREANLPAVFDATGTRTGSGKMITMHVDYSENHIGTAYYHVSEWAKSRKKLFGAWMKVDWIDADNGQTGGGQLKLMDMEQGTKHATSPGICENTTWAYDTANNGGTSSQHYAVWYSGPTLYRIGDKNLYSAQLRDDTWQYVLFEYEESELNTANGNLNIYKSVTTSSTTAIGKASMSNKTSYTVEGYVAEYAKLRAILETGSTGCQEAIVYYDDVYIDNSWARVEIGDASIYDNCTHREIQIPTSWSSNAISIKVNTGSFASGDIVYLFVIDPDGSVSPGYKMTVGSDAINPPQNFMVQSY
jgi:hypothetical protein